MSLLQAVRAATGSIRSLAVTSSGQKAGDSASIKRPMTGFFQYQSEKFQEARRQSPSMDVKSISKTLAAQWNMLSEEKKKPYNDKFRAELEAYKARVERMPEAEVDLLKENRKNKKANKKIRELKAEIKSLTEDKPVRPLSAYVLYISERLNSSLKSLPQQERIKVAAAEWNSLPTQQKESFNNRAKTLQDKYAVEFKKWTEKTEKDGRGDKIRSVKDQLKEIKL